MIECSNRKNNDIFDLGCLGITTMLIFQKRYWMSKIEHFGGIFKQMPKFSIFFMVYCLGAISFPGTTGFIGEFLILLGAFKINFIICIFAASGVILSACYILWLYNRVCFGTNSYKGIVDLNTRDTLVYLIFLLLIIILGIYPNFLISFYELSTNKLIII